MLSSKKNIQAAERLSSSTNIIGQGALIEGHLQASENVRFEGRINGNITTQSKLVSSGTSHIKGNVLAQSAEVSGTVEGKLEIADVLTLRATAVIKGNIETHRLIVESGARFDGECRMRAESKQVALPVSGTTDGKRAGAKSKTNDPLEFEEEEFKSEL